MRYYNYSRDNTTLNHLQDNKHAGDKEEPGPDSPVAHHLDKACGLQMEKDVRDDISTAQHALQTLSL